MIGTTLGHYRVVEKIGAGGMGVVYRAHDERLDRDVAIKVLPEEVAGDLDRLHRFEREAKALAALNHPNIATVHGFESFEFSESNVGAGFIPARSPSQAGEEPVPTEVVHILVMELLEGEPLRALISKESTTTGKAVEYAGAIADGLAAAHDKGIIHRDLKPENVFLTKDGRIKILDFGLAKLELPEANLATETPTATLDTAPGDLVGTIPYMAPEQLQGQPADHRSDIFALGVVLYEMLTGHRPFGGSTSVETAAAILKEDPEPISAAAPGVPPTLAGVVSKCLEKRPEDRFFSAHDLALTLGAFDTAAQALPAEDRSVISKRWPHILAVIIAAVIGFLVILPPEALFERGLDEPAEALPPRVVVLPFENLGSPDDEYFADGMTEEIISRLSAVSGLLVISRTSAMQYKDTDKGIRQIGEELNVQYALEGTVRWERGGKGFGRVRITPQLIKVADDSHLWSDRYDRGIESVFEVQSDIARHVVDQLRVSLLEPEDETLDAQPTDVPEAYAAYLRGLHNLSLNDFDKTLVAVKMFERAVELDPGFAEAWARLGRIHAWLFGSTFDTSPERRRLAREAVEESLELDPNLPEGHLALGFYYYRCDRDYERALGEFAETLAIQPNHVEALSAQSAVLRRQGKWEESTKLLERVSSASPRDSHNAYSLSTNYEFLRDYQLAEKYADLSIALAPDGLDGYTRKFYFLLDQGRIRDARAFFEDLPVRFPRLEIYGIVMEIADREFETALGMIRGTPAEVFERTIGRGGAEYRMRLECECLFFLGNRQGIQEACGRARVALEQKVPEFGGNWFLHSELGLVYAYLGRREDAVREGETALTLVADDALRSTTFGERFAHICALVGEPETAMEQIEYLLSIPSSLTVGELRVHPYWDPLRDEPRFQALLEKYDTEN